MYRQRCVAKTVLFVGKSIRRVPQTCNLPEKSKKMVNFFSRLPRKPWRQLTTDDSLQETDSRNPTSHKATGLSIIRTLTRVQLVCNTTDNLSDENNYLYRVFLKNNYRKKRNRNSYDYSNYTLHKGHVWEHPAHPTTLQYPHRPQTHHHTRPVTNKRQTQRGTARGTDRKRFIRSIAPTATPPTSERLTETSLQDWLNTGERRGKVMSPITPLNIIDLRTTLLTETLRNA